MRSTNERPKVAGFGSLTLRRVQIPWVCQNGAQQPTVAAANRTIHTLVDPCRLRNSDIGVLQMNSLAQYDAITRCPQCEAKLNASASWFGQTLECPRCASTFAFQLITSGATNDTAKVATLTQTDSKRAGKEDPGKKASRVAAIPRQLGRYLPQRCLGQGGFGVVYLATDPSLQRDVAIKLPYLGRDQHGNETNQQVRERFHKEAQAAARLRHPNIVAVFDHGQTDDGVYIVYEFVPGETLEDRMVAKSIDRDHAVRLVATLADALSYAATENIVHRDIKPANIMIDSHGRPQIMDFGLAVALHEGKALTGGRIAGTPSYMSPEQARGEKQIGPSADQYSLCAILYELVSGTKSVTAKGIAAVAEVADRAQPPVEPLASLPQDLRQILLRGMRSEPADRYDDCSGLAEDLRLFLGGYPVGANPIGLPKRVQKWASRNVATAVATLATAFLLVTVAAVSTFAAVQLQQRGLDLQAALLQAEGDRAKAEEQTRIAKEQTAKAERLRGEAEQQRKEAESQKLIAQKSQKNAEDALKREIEERDMRLAAESIADSESKRRMESDNAADAAKSELQDASEENRALQYSEWLTQAAGEILRNDLSAARQTLQRCGSEDRDWEWRWLDQNTVSSREFRPLSRVPENLAKRLQPPAILASKLGFQTYDASELGRKAPTHWRNPITMRTGRNKRIGAFVHHENVTPADRARTGVQPFQLQYLRKVDLASGTFQDVCDKVDSSAGVHLLGDGDYASIVTLEPEPQVNDARAKTSFQRFAEVWSLEAVPRQMLRLPIAESDWVPSFAISADNNSIFGALSPGQLHTWNTDDATVQHVAQLGFALAVGPRSLSLLPDGRLAMIDQAGAVHYAHPHLGDVDSGTQWNLAEGLAAEWLWDSSGRYLGLFQQAEATVRKVPRDQYQAQPTRVWHIIDAAQSRLHCSIDMPMTVSAGAVVVVEDGPNFMVLKARTLPIRQLELGQSGDLVAVRDSFGGMWAWQREEHIGTEEYQLSTEVPIKIAARDGQMIAGTDGISLMAIDLAGPIPRPQKLFRRRGGEIVDLVVDELSQRIATVDVDGVVTVFDDGRQAAQVQIAEASKLAFASRGDSLFVGTLPGELHLLDCDQGKVVRRQLAHSSSVQALAAMHNLRMIASVGVNRSLRFWDMITGQRVDIPETLVSAPVTHLLYEASRKRLIVFTQTNVEFFECSETGVQRQGSSALTHRVQHACVLDTGTRIIACGDQNSTVLDATTGRAVYSLPRSNQEISAVHSDAGDPWFLLASGLAKHLRTREQP